MKLKLSVEMEFIVLNYIVKKSTTVNKILKKIFPPLAINDYQIFIVTYQDHVLEKDEKIGKYVKEKEATLKVIPICYPPVDCKFMKNPVLLKIMYTNTYERVWNGKLIPPYEYAVKMMAIAFYEKYIEDVDRFKNGRVSSSPMPSWTTTKYNVEKEKWNNDVIIEFNKLSFDDRFQAMEEYLKVATNADVYGHEVFYTDEEQSSFFHVNIHGIKIFGIFDEVNYFQWQQVKFIRREGQVLSLRLEVPNEASLFTLKIRFPDSEDANAFISYCITLLCLGNVESTFHNYEISDKLVKKGKKEVEYFIKTKCTKDPPETYLIDERTKSVDNLWMDEEYLADTNPRNESNDESEFTSGHYTTEYGNKYENKVQEKDENEETDETTENEFEFKESESEKYKEKGEYDDCTIEDIEREYHKREETGTKEEQGTEQLQKYMENHTGYAAAMSDSKHQSVQDQSSTLYNKEFKIPLDYELNERALQNLIIDCIDEDELIKSIKKKLKFVENTSEDKYDLDVKIEISATLMAEDFSENPKDKNNSDQGEDKNNEEAETAV
ncbi:hypothetical protein Tsp_10918 [Trichinella spiralis]|uniref:Uncharacterized protein n=1 Tax=Trichinella spiralis TaxID=6334 RepID=E5S6Z0_TRISP|nr:hypothetical protein Tsp_10918 [Trichinella spiralis]KRY39206.1 hypothetical protein T01_11547 [Trichinella spiralis]